MSKSKYLIPIFLLILLAFNVFASGEILVLDTDVTLEGTYYLHNYNFARLSNGTIVGVHGFNKTLTFIWSCDNGETWDNNTLDSGSYFYNCKLVVDSTDKISLLWSEGTTAPSWNYGDVKFSWISFTNKSLYGTFELYSDQYFVDIDMCADGDDNLHCVYRKWSNNGGLTYNIIYYKSYSKILDDWSTTIKVIDNECLRSNSFCNLKIITAYYDNQYIPYVYFSSQVTISGFTSGTTYATWLPFYNQNNDCILKIGEDTKDDGQSGKTDVFSGIDIGYEHTGENIFSVRSTNNNTLTYEILDVGTQTLTGSGIVYDGSDGGYSQENPEISIDNYENAHIVWSAKTYVSSHYKMRYRKFDISQESFETSVAYLTTGSDDHRFPELLYSPFPSSQICSSNYFLIYKNTTDKEIVYYDTISPIWYGGGGGSGGGSGSIPPEGNNTICENYKVNKKTIVTQNYVQQYEPLVLLSMDGGIEMFYQHEMTGNITGFEFITHPDLVSISDLSQFTLYVNGVYVGKPNSFGNNGYTLTWNDFIVSINNVYPVFKIWWNKPSSSTSYQWSFYGHRDNDIGIPYDFVKNAMAFTDEDSLTNPSMPYIDGHYQTKYFTYYCFDFSQPVEQTYIYEFTCDYNLTDTFKLNNYFDILVTVTPAIKSLNYRLLNATNDLTDGVISFSLARNKFMIPSIWLDQNHKSGTYKFQCIESNQFQESYPQWDSLHDGEHQFNCVYGENRSYSITPFKNTYTQGEMVSFGCTAPYNESIYVVIHKGIEYKPFLDNWKEDYVVFNTSWIKGKGANYTLNFINRFYCDEVGLYGMTMYNKTREIWESFNFFRVNPKSGYYELNIDHESLTVGKNQIFTGYTYFPLQDEVNTRINIYKDGVYFDYIPIKSQGDFRIEFKQTEVGDFYAYMEYASLPADGYKVYWKGLKPYSVGIPKIIDEYIPEDYQFILGLVIILFGFLTIGLIAKKLELDNLPSVVYMFGGIAGFIIDIKFELFDFWMVVFFTFVFTVLVVWNIFGYFGQFSNPLTRGFSRETKQKESKPKTKEHSEVYKVWDKILKNREKARKK